MRTLRDQAPRGGCFLDARRMNVPMSRSAVHSPKVFSETEWAGAVWLQQGGHMRKLQVRIALVLATGLALASCGADPTNFGTLPADLTSNKITGDVHEWGIDVSAHKAAAGDVTFAIANFGSIPHEFIVVKTDYELGKIPVGANNRFDEEGDGVKAIDEIKEFPVNSAEVLTVNLEPGTYQLLCNIEGHYQNGMFTAFIVE